MNNSSTGLTENVASALCYLLGFISGLVFLIIEKENKVVRFNALQSLITFIALGVFSTVVNFLVGWIPLLGGLITSVVGLCCFLVWAYMLFVNFTGKTATKLPIVGDICWEQANK